NTADGGDISVTNLPDVNVTTLGPDRMLFYVGVDTNGDGGTWTPPTGFNERQGGASVTTCEISDHVQTPAGASGNTHASNTPAGRAGAWMGALIGTTPSTVEFGAARPTNRHPGAGPGTARFYQTPRPTDITTTGTTWDPGTQTDSVGLTDTFVIEQDKVQTD